MPRLFLGFLPPQQYPLESCGYRRRQGRKTQSSWRHDWRCRIRSYDLLCMCPVSCLSYVADVPPQTTHLKLVNAIAKAAEDLNLPKEHDHSAHRLHSDLFASGIERILLVRLFNLSLMPCLTVFYRLRVKLRRLTTLLCIWSYRGISCWSPEHGSSCHGRSPG